MTIKEFIKNVKISYSNILPDSKIIIRFDNRLYSSIGISLLLAKNESEVANGILENDMLSISFSIAHDNKPLDRNLTLDSIIPDNLQLEVYKKWYLIKPEDKYHVYSTRNLNFRKTKGDSKKLIKTLDKYFNMLKDSLINDLENNLIHDSHVELLKNKIKVVL